MSLPRGKAPARVGDVLRERIAALGWERRLREEEVLTGWADAVGPQIAAHAHPSHVVNHRLTVVTESPVWTQQLALLKPDLLRRIASRFGHGAVTDLFFVTGRLDPPAASQEAAPAARSSRDHLPADLEGELDLVGDGGVRESIRRLILAALADGGPGA